MKRLKILQHTWLAVFFFLLLLWQVFREYGLAGISGIPDFWALPKAGGITSSSEDS